MAAKNSHAKAQYSLAAMYMNGAGVDKSAERGIFWLEKAADLGNTEAQTVLAGYLFNGVGVAADKKWEAAAKKGVAFAAKNLAKMYLYGSGVEMNHSLFAKWTKVAADLGDVESMYNISIAYKNGDGVEKSPELAKLYMEKFNASGGWQNSQSGIAPR